MPAVHLLVQGKVQGVFYRASAKEVAERLGLQGWVKNTSEGHVEIMVQGDADKIKVFEKWCWKGPSRAKVDQVIAEPSEEQLLSGFMIVR